MAQQPDPSTQTIPIEHVDPLHLRARAAVKSLGLDVAKLELAVAVFGWGSSEANGSLTSLARDAAGYCGGCVVWSHTLCAWGADFGRGSVVWSDGPVEDALVLWLEIEAKIQNPEQAPGVKSSEDVVCDD